MNTEINFDELRELLEARNFKALRTRLADMNEVDVAQFLCELAPEDARILFRTLPKQMAADVFSNLESDVQQVILESATDSELSQIIEELYVDDAVDMLEELPANVVKRVLKNATSETRTLINQYLQYPENSAGSIMTAEFIDLRASMKVKDAIEHIRHTGEDSEAIYTCYVIDARRVLEGVVTVKELLLAKDDTLVSDLMERDVISVGTLEDQEEVTRVMSKYDLLSLPVVDNEKRLVGIVTVDDAMDVMEQEATEDFEIMAGMTPSDKPYSRTSILEMWKNRIPWLMFLMLSATFTSMILTSFEDRLAVQAGLVAFIPMLMGTGGNSGAQSSTAVIRSLSIGDTEPGDALRVMWKELRVAFLCGITLAAVNFVKMLLVDGMLLRNDNITLAVAATVSLSVLFIVMFAKVVGSALPILAEKIGVDPAVMANPLISTVTDAVSLLIYIYIAKLILHI